MDPSKLKLTPMTLADLDVVMEIELKCYPYPWTLKNFTDCMSANYLCWTYRDEDKIIGYLVISIAVEELHILNICIAPEHQGQGLGKALLHQAERMALDAEAKEAFLEVRPSNLSAVFLYEHNGWNQVGIRKGYYPTDNGREDAMIMAKALFL